MSIRDKIGVGIVTCNRQDYLQNLLQTLSQCNNIIDKLVIVNDGDSIEELSVGTLINNDTNIGVGKSKNKAMQYLLDAECDYIFIIEDDLLIKDPRVFSEYINRNP